MKPLELSKDEYAPAFEAYIGKLPDIDIFQEMEISVHQFIQFVQNIPIGKHDYRYAEGKWTIKDIIQHLIDCERIFAYRAMRIARNDKTELPGFDENIYAESAHANTRTILDLLTEFSAVRHATLMLFKTFNREDLMRQGTASNKIVSVRAIACVIVGHQHHHQNVFAERYF